MTFTVHSAIADTNAAALNDRMREASCMEFMSEMEAAVEFGAQCITVHPGIVNLAMTDMREKSIRASKDTMRLLDRAQTEYGVRLAIENMPDVPVMLGVKASELEEIVAGTDLGICLDVGHANTSGQLDAMIDAFRDRIVNVHIHDNNGKRDEHLTIGDGSIDFPAVMKKLSFYKGRYIIESRNLESAVESQKRLRDMITKAF
ncbi:MAG: sugar phosphate isomerase/epimerase [Candidatus Methanomethylophilus sp.]|jgi:sugar phosphate isomerase/epimerase|nr:sugar phosphate isomerase/epimerase [Methanomethylophilus sp.]MCI2074819.1 sugar phosphate isomerase/epimerase [Methanomethylophilus sp.]MCI2092261.1 sugar phosphate isomerase/epimerase [Methanomethylophilus sp.]MEE3401042.1 sugar phosphate isomerase/epimerase family protein [Methanomethylophilus sp.]